MNDDLASALIMLLRQETVQEKVDPNTFPPGTAAWLYLRHSPGDNQTIESQEAEAMRIVRGKGWVVREDRIFKDCWSSGKSVRNRENFEEMFRLALQQPREANLLVIWALDRFARNQLHSQLCRVVLRMSGWHILPLKDSIPVGPESLIFEALIDWQNERFLRDIRANTIRGLRFIVEKGCLPNGQICKGYRVQRIELGTYRDGTPREGRKPELDSEVAQLVETAFEMKARGTPHALIAEKTGLYGPKSSAWGHLFRNRIYIGEYTFQGEVYTNVYPALISPELFEAVQKRLPKPRPRLGGRNHPRRKGSNYFLANIAICAHCGGAMEGKGAGKGAANQSPRYRYYKCSENCAASTYIPAELVEERVLQTLLDHVLHPAYIEELWEWTKENLGTDLTDLRLRRNRVRDELGEAIHLAKVLVDRFAQLEEPSRFAEERIHQQEVLVAQLEREFADIQHELDVSEVKVSRRDIETYVSETAKIIQGEEQISFSLRQVCEGLCSRIIMEQDECTLEIHFPRLA